jgi:hypothetical protein
MLLEFSAVVQRSLKVNSNKNAVLNKQKNSIKAKSFFLT